MCGRRCSGRLGGSSCSWNAHYERDWKGTHVGPVLPERAASERMDEGLSFDLRGTRSRSVLPGAVVWNQVVERMYYRHGRGVSTRSSRENEMVGNLSLHEQIADRS